MFCPRCGSLLRPKIDKNKKTSACSCGYTGDVPRSGIKEQVTAKKDIDVIEEVETKPKVEASCEKCGNKEAYFWSLQTRAADEPETRFFKCVKCKHTWREYK